MNRFDPEGTATPVEEALELRVHGDPARPTLVYLPGLHGDWTLIGRFRRALGDTARFVEMTYPRTLTWSLDEYAQRIEAALAGRGISSGWLLGESFGSQLAWALLARGKFKADGVILAGGFVRHPAVWGVRAAARLTAGISLSLITRILFGYARLARARHLRNPEIMQEISDFISRRTEQDRRAATHRLRLLAASNFCATARNARVPVYAITGAFDPIVPWFCVRRWLGRNCPALREYRVVWSADHNVLGTASGLAARQVLAWMGARTPSP